MAVERNRNSELTNTQKNNSHTGLWIFNIIVIIVIIISLFYSLSFISAFGSLATPKIGISLNDSTKEFKIPITVSNPQNYTIKANFNIGQFINIKNNKSVNLNLKLSEEYIELYPNQTNNILLIGRTDESGKYQGNVIVTFSDDSNRQVSLDSIIQINAKYNKNNPLSFLVIIILVGIFFFILIKYLYRLKGGKKEVKNEENNFFIDSREFSNSTF